MSNSGLIRNATLKKSVAVKRSIIKEGRSSLPILRAHTRKIQERHFNLNNQNTAREKFGFLSIADNEKADHIHMFVNNNKNNYNNYYYCYLFVLLPWKRLDDWLFNFLAEGYLNEDSLYPTA
jgi:hypothetical protein